MRSRTADVRGSGSKRRPGRPTSRRQPRIKAPKTATTGRHGTPEVRTVSRVDWNDLTSLIEGEAIVLFGGRRVYARVFHAQIDDKGPKRIGRSVMLSAPDHDVVRARADRLAELAQVIEQGALVTANGEEASPVLDALRDGFIAAAGRKASMQECAAAALAAVQALPESALPPRPAAPSDGLPVTAVTPMLKAAAQGPVLGPERKTSNGEMVNGELCRGLIAIERLVGVPPIARAQERVRRHPAA